MFREISLTGANSDKYPYFLIDDEDFEKIKSYNWTCDKLGYISMSRHNISYHLHRFLLDCKSGDGKIIDHKNRKPWDNRRRSLRLVTREENARNRAIVNPSGVPGLNWSERRKKYTLHYFHKDLDLSLYLGTIQDPIKAKALRRRFIQRIRGLKTRKQIDRVVFEFLFILRVIESKNFLGVKQEKDTLRYSASKEFNERLYSIGSYETPELAFKAYKKFHFFCYDVQDHNILLSRIEDIKEEFSGKYRGISYNSVSNGWELEYKTQQDKVVYITTTRTKDIALKLRTVLCRVIEVKGEDALDKTLLKKLRVLSRRLNKNLKSS